MAENLNENLNEEVEGIEDNTCFLIDEEGNENPFEIIGTLEIDGCEYVAFMPVDSDECEYVILKKERDENGEDIYATIEDDDEFENVAEVFEDEIFGDLDLDLLEGDEEEEE